MTFDYQGQQYRLPVTLRDITLRQRIDFDEQYGKELSARADEVDALQDGIDKSLECLLLHSEYAMAAFSFFTGIPHTDVENSFDIDQVRALFDVTLVDLLKQPADLLPVEGVSWANEQWFLPPVELTPASDQVFNEFLLSKEIARQLASIGMGRWAAIPFIAAIHLRKAGEPFTDDLAQEDGPRVQLMYDLPMDIAAAVAFFYDQHNTYLDQNFSVFQKRIGKGPNMRAHFERWGWISFLTYIAEAGVFTITGFNAIESAKRAKSYDVLVYASEKKDHEEAIEKYYESLR